MSEIPELVNTYLLEATDDEIFMVLRGRGWGIVPSMGDAIHRKHVQIAPPEEVFVLLRGLENRVKELEDHVSALRRVPVIKIGEEPPS